MEQQLLKKDLLENKLLLKGCLEMPRIFIQRILNCLESLGCIYMFEGLSSIERLWIMMLDILSRPERTISDPEEFLITSGEKPPSPMGVQVRFVCGRCPCPVDCGYQCDFDRWRRPCACDFHAEYAVSVRFRNHGGRIIYVVLGKGLRNFFA